MVLYSIHITKVTKLDRMSIAWKRNLNNNNNMGRNYMHNRLKSKKEMFVF